MENCLCARLEFVAGLRGRRMYPLARACCPTAVLSKHVQRRPTQILTGRRTQVQQHPCIEAAGKMACKQRIALTVLFPGERLDSSPIQTIRNQIRDQPARASVRLVTGEKLLSELIYRRWKNRLHQLATKWRQHIAAGVRRREPQVRPPSINQPRSGESIQPGARAGVRPRLCAAAAFAAKYQKTNNC